MQPLDISKFPITVFGSILGTGGFALASRTFLPFIVLPLIWILMALFALFSGLFLAKLMLHPGTVKAELTHPLPGNFYALQPISAVILAILGWHALPMPAVLGLLVYGAGLIFALAIYLPYHFFSNVNIEFSQLHGGWLITPVATILVTNAVLLYPVSEGVLVVALLFFGIGAMLFILVLGSLFFRLISHTLPPAELAPTNYIMLAPVGILIVDILRISAVAGNLFGSNLVSLGILAGVCLWGFGFWVIGVNLLHFIRFVHSGFRFQIGWWSYVFPTAAFTLGTVSLSSYLAALRTASLFLYVSLAVIILIVALGSLKQILKFKTRMPHTSYV